MCAIAFIIEPDKISLYSDGYSKNLADGSEIWDHSKIHPIDSHTAMMSMGYWSEELYGMIASLRGKPSQIAEKASRLLKDYFTDDTEVKEHGSKLLVLGFEADRPVLFDIRSENDFNIVMPIPDNWPFDSTPFLAAALNGVTENPGFAGFVIKEIVRNPEIGFQGQGLAAFKAMIQAHKNKGTFGGEIYTDTLTNSD